MRRAPIQISQFPKPKQQGKGINPDVVVRERTQDPQITTFEQGTTQSGATFQIRGQEPQMIAGKKAQNAVSLDDQVENFRQRDIKRGVPFYSVSGEQFDFKGDNFVRPLPNELQAAQQQRWESVQKEVESFMRKRFEEKMRERETIWYKFKSWFRTVPPGYGLRGRVE